ncbi:N-acylneuraminate cytidylyltransferase-like [Leptinotarsa decemlineata]|uniref:N-acylneuraminate cytidylyltransferase-like n=1 Tax=Leptinotarsa decemlineata TaxID=7539 RepID=UPI003D305D1A
MGHEEIYLFNIHCHSDMTHISLLFLGLLSVIIDTRLCCEYFPWNPLRDKNNHFAILVLARGGSKGIKLKNLSRVGGNSLLAISVREVNKLRGIDSVWVSTDHEKIAELAENENVNVHWRAPESATDEASSLLGIIEFLKHHPEVDILGLVQCTSPFIKSSYLQQAVNHMQNGKECTFAATRSYKLRWQKLGDRLIPLNFDLKKRPRRQDFDGELVENGMFYFFSRRLIQQGVLQSNK